ncbi:MAG: N-acetyl-gamma-glutamyl-phosphate reductase [Micrococcales bacterium]|nr:N-acetyl-gamma-glutamyl-phosphate reductase [Micrococcales bacterium]
MQAHQSFSVAVAGASGYAGGEVLRLLANHPNAQIKTVTANANAGDSLSNHQPHLVSLNHLVLEPTEPAKLAQHEVIFVALPHGASGKLTVELEQLAPHTLIIDLGADHRLVNPDDWAVFYGGEAAEPWTYGLPELVTGWGEAPPKQRSKLPGATRIAVPGCNATAVTLALGPGIAAGYLDPSDLVAVLACGPSGAGKALKPHLLASEILGSTSPYAVGGSHRHIPEIIQSLNQAAPAKAAKPALSFTPTLVPMARGILATVTAKPGPKFDQATLRQPWEVAYQQEPFIQLLPQGTWPTTAQTLGSNSAALQLTFDQAADRVVMVCALDNLVKGTAGAGVQAMNLALGLPEATGLTVNGVLP